MLYLNGHRYFWNENKKYWSSISSFLLKKKYYYSIPNFLNVLNSPKINILNFRAKIISFRRSNIFLRFGFTYRWNKTLFFNRMSLFFIIAKQRLGFLKLWNLGLSKELVIKYPFLAFKKNFNQKYFFSLKYFFFKSFYFRFLLIFLFV